MEANGKVEMLQEENTKLSELNATSARKLRIANRRTESLQQEKESFSTELSDKIGSLRAELKTTKQKLCMDYDLMSSNVEKQDANIDQMSKELQIVKNVLGRYKRRFGYGYCGYCFEYRADYSLPCGHTYCWQCWIDDAMANHLNNTHKCPTCRAPCGVYDGHNITLAKGPKWSDEDTEEE